MEYGTIDGPAEMTTDMTGLPTTDEDPPPPSRETDGPGIGGTLLCFGAGVLDGAAPLISPIAVMTGGDLPKRCGTTYTVGTVVGTVGSMAAGVGEAVAVARGVAAAARGASMLSKAARAAGAGLRVVAKRTAQKHLGPNTARTVLRSVRKEAITRTAVAIQKGR